MSTRRNFIFEQKKTLVMLFLIILTFIHYGINRVEPTNGFAWMITLVVWFCGLINIRKSIPLIIFYVFIFSYIVVPYHYYFSFRQISFYTDFQSEVLINQVAFLNTMFLAVFGYMIIGINDINLSNPREWCKSNKFVFYISLLPCLISLLFGLTGESIISAGYGSGLSNKSALHEYFIVFSLFCWLFMEKNNRLQWSILLVFIVGYCLKTLIYGGRIEVVQVLLLLGFAGSNYLKSYSKLKLFFFAGVFFVGLLSLGIVRGNLPALAVSERPISKFFEIIFRPDTNPYVLSTSADVYYASMRLVGMADAGYIDLDFRVVSFISFVFNLPLTFSSLKDAANLASLHSSVFPVGGGGLVSAYFFIWMGYLGVLIGAFILGFAIRKLYKSQHFFWRIYGILILVTFPRWWAYTPINLTKLCFVGVILYAIYLAVASFFSTKNNSIPELR